MAETNRRQSPRQTTQSEVQAFFTADMSKSPNACDDFVPVSMRNQSDNGLYIEVHHAIEPGSNISIKMVAPEEQRSENPYYIRDGQVVWCKKVDDRSSLFGVGIKILRKVVQADVLTSRFQT